MRPTSLGFRSPKERTAEFYNPQVTSDGRKLDYNLKSYSSTGTNFTNEKRFEEMAIKIKS